VRLGQAVGEVAGLVDRVPSGRCHKYEGRARIGQQLLDLVPDSTYDADASRNAGGFLHFCVGIEAGRLPGIVAWLKERGVNVLEEQPVPRMGATGMGLSIYITDPDGYVVELKEHGA